MLSPTASTFRLFLHVLAACIWIGGQFALAGIVPTLRASAPATTTAVARAFARVAWPAFGVLVLTGVWNLVEVGVGDTSTAYQVTVFAKVLLALASGGFALVHQLGRTKAALAIGGAFGALTGLLALFLGILLRTGAA